MSNISRAPASSFTKIQPYCGFQQRYLDPILLKRPETFYPDIVRYLRPETRLLERDGWENH